MKKILFVLIMTLTFTSFAQESNKSVDMGIGLSNQTLDGRNYQTIALLPELDLGFFGLGLNVDLRFTLLVDQDGPTFEIYRDDWIIDNGDFKEYLSLYLSKFAYIRLGHKGENFYMKAGEFNNATLGNGTILNNYSNMQHLPKQRIFGLALDIDGALFHFPIMGFETFIGNVAAMDIIGSRLFFRPLVTLEIPVISNLELGVTGVIDRDPFFFVDNVDSPKNLDVSVYGADLTIPVVDSSIFSMGIYGDMVFQPKANAIFYGLKGSLISLVKYKLEYIDQGENFIPQYFDSAYDLNRTGSNYEILTGAYSGEPYEAKKDLSASLGLEIPQILYFDASLTGLLTMMDMPQESVEEAPHLYPSLKGNLHIPNDILQIVSADFFYYKIGIDSFDSLTDPTNAMIGGKMNYYSGNMVVSFLVDVKYNGDADLTAEPPEDEWITNTQISVNFKL